MALSLGAWSLITVVRCRAGVHRGSVSRGDSGPAHDLQQLAIVLGLESVEYLHHRHQAAEIANKLLDE